MRADHVVVKCPSMDLECLHCGAVQTHYLPERVSEFVKLGREFTKLHKGCKQPLERSAS